MGVERQHDFHIISVSAIYLHFGLKITLQDDPVALKTRPKLHTPGRLGRVASGTDPIFDLLSSALVLAFALYCGDPCQTRFFFPNDFLIRNGTTILPKWNQNDSKIAPKIEAKK